MENLHEKDEVGWANIENNKKEEGKDFMKKKESWKRIINI